MIGVVTRHGRTWSARPVVGLWAGGFASRRVAADWLAGIIR